MEIVGTIVIGIVMACAVAGAVASLFNEEEGLGREFREGIHAIGHIFIPVAGIMASILGWSDQERREEVLAAMHELEQMQLLTEAAAHRSAPGPPTL